MRLTLMGMALGLALPLGLAHASIESDLKSAQPMQTVFTNALASNVSADAALKQIMELAPEQAYTAITAAILLSPDQAAIIVSAALDRRYNLNPAQVVAAAVQGAPDKAAIIVPTAIVKSPSYYTVPIVQRALAEGVDGAKFVPQAMRTSPRQAPSILTQALRAAPQQTKSIMEAVISDQPDKAVDYVRIALDAKAPPLDVLTAAFKVAPRQAESIAAVAAEKGISSQLIAAASAAAGVEVAGMSNVPKGFTARQGPFILLPLTPPSAGGIGGGGCSPTVASCS